jgi:hypothetical protein
MNKLDNPTSATPQPTQAPNAILEELRKLKPQPSARTQEELDALARMAQEATERLNNLSRSPG